MSEIALLREEFDRIGEEIKNTPKGTKEYRELLSDWKIIYDCILAHDKAEVEKEFKNSELIMKENELTKPFFKRPDVWLQLLTVFAHLLGIGAILTHEDSHVLSSRALGLVNKLRFK